MKAQIIYHLAEFGHNWNLYVTFKNKKTKSFYLGQDVKFCRRVLGLEPKELIHMIGMNTPINMDEPKVQKKIGKFIVEHLGLTEKMLKDANTWDLACQ